MTATTWKTDTKFYTWKNYRCAYEFSPGNNPDAPPLLLVHPIGVGLSGKFWQRFCREWTTTGKPNSIYNPDLLGCGDSDMPRIAYNPADWAEQLLHFITNVVQKPVILVVQGALFPVAIKLVHLPNAANWVRGLVLSGPPPWPLITSERPKWRQKLIWNLFFDAPAGNGFYRYARTSKFLRNFSIRQLFAESQDVDGEWLETLQLGAKNLASRYAVFSFLAGFWRENYQEDIARITQPTLVVMGEKASSISREGKQETPEERLADYLKTFPNAQGIKIPKRNVLPYEATAEFVGVVAPFVAGLA